MSWEPIIQEIVYGLTGWKSSVEDVQDGPLIFEARTYQGAVDKMEDMFLSRKWSDGLPLVPPTRDRVDWLLTGTDLDPHETLTRDFGPRFCPIRVRDVAVNAAMAGARPEYMPVILATIKLLGSKDGLEVMYPLTQSQHSFAPVIIINGPVARELDINGSIGLMGPGNRANATIGRSISLLLINGAGAYAGQGGLPTTHSLPGRYTWCFAENEENSPWEPLHVELGHEHPESTVTVMGGRGTQALMVSPPATKILNSIKRALEGVTVTRYPIPWDQLLILSPEHARVLVRSGWSKAEIKRYLHENASISEEEAVAARSTLSKEKGEYPEKGSMIGRPVPVIAKPDHLVIIVAGATGANTSTFIPSIMKRVTGQIDPFKPANWKELLEEGRKGAR
ncbi:MAG: hypothetical protein JRJ03_02590 [Deltaproteobacteria bacterium]|nr:hypothetical protein [Deltaproteobacteria bacterium]MBW2063801.1 hypothetical protein [Deltaproteobacteria bacterium]